MKWKKGAVRLKKIRVLIPALCMGLVLFGCSKEEKPVAAAPSQYKTADELIQEVEQKEKEESMSRAAQAFGQTAGTYLCSSPEIDSEYWPMLELGVEGKAVFRANLLTGMGELTGNYLVDGDTVQISVETVSFTGFTGENVQDMVFRIVSDSILELSYTTPDVPIGLTNPGDRFVKSTEEAASGTGGGSAQG